MSHFKVISIPFSLLGLALSRAKTRHTLHAMSDHMLKDMGINRSEIDRIVKILPERRG